MRHYELYLKAFLIGRLEWDTQCDKYRYTAVCPLVVELDKKYPIPPELLRDSDGWVDPMPFFATRIYQMERWNLTELNYQTDWFLLKRIE